MRRLALLALLAAAVASAQAPPLDARGGLGASVAVGGPAPARLLFPPDADPALTLGVRLAPGIELSGGAQVRDRAAAPQASPYRPAESRRTKTSAAVLALSVVEAVRAPVVGVAHVRGRLSVGYDYFSASEHRGGPPELRQSVIARERFGHVGASAEVGVPVQAGAVEVAPSVGVAAAATVSAEEQVWAAPSRWMPYLKLPATVRVGGLALTAEATAGMARGVPDRRADFWALELRERPTLGPWAPVVEGAMRVAF